MEYWFKSYANLFPSAEIVLRENPDVYSYVHEEAREIAKIGKKFDVMVAEDKPIPKYDNFLKNAMMLGYNIGLLERRLDDVISNELFGYVDAEEIKGFFNEAYGKQFIKLVANSLDDKLAKRIAREVGENKVKAILG